MAPKIVFLAVLACFFATSVAASPYKEQELDGIFDHLIEAAERILLTVNEGVNKAIGSVAVGLTKGLSAVNNLGQGLIKVANEGIEKEVQLIHGLLENLKNIATQQALLQCIEDNEQQIGAIESNAVESAVNCIDGALQQIGNDTLAVLSDIQDLNNEIIAQDKTLEDCKSKVIPVDCITNVINNLVDLALTLPVKVKGSAGKVEADFDALSGVLQKCVQDATALVKKEADQLVNDVQECAENQNSSFTL